MGRITSTNVAVAIVTMVTVYVGGETNICWCMDWIRKAKLIWR